jgi:hypothetical protein
MALKINRLYPERDKCRHRIIGFDASEVITGKNLLEPMGRISRTRLYGPHGAIKD